MQRSGALWSSFGHLLLAPKALFSERLGRASSGEENMRYGGKKVTYSVRVDIRNID